MWATRIHERAGVRLARRKLPILQFPKRLAAQLVFGRVIAFGADAVEVEAIGVSGGRAADMAVPSVVVPRNAQIKVMKGRP